MNPHLLKVVCCVLAVLGIAGGVRAQIDSDIGFSSGGEIGLRVSSFGLASKPRPGSWTPIQVDIKHRSSNPKPLAIIVRIEIRNDDGDVALVEREVTTSPSRTISTWLYARLPFGTDTQSEFRISAFLKLDQESGGATLGAYDPSKPVGMTVVRSSSAISPYAGLIGVVGRRGIGLDRYSERLANGSDFAPTGHELTEIASGLMPAGLPDRVHGLRALEALVWAGSAPDEQPGKLSIQQADAIREWVASGGHMIIVMPLVGQTWIDTPNPLSDILPAVHANRLDGVSLEPLRFLLTTYPDAALPRTSIMYTFTPDPAAGPFDAMPILTGPDGAVLVARRLVGIGAVTIIGLDLPNLATATGALRTDAFWNRVLGKRLDLTPLKELEQRKPPVFWPSGRQEQFYERSIPATINREGKAALGLLLAVVVFAAFWLTAGPVGFFFLKQRKRVQHAWVGYVAAIGAFTALSWGASTALRQRSADGTHVTLLDHVYGQPNQRARAWANVYLPTFGSERVSVTPKSFEIAGQPFTATPAVAPWEDPASTGASREFPESRTYLMDARSPSAVQFPSRSTTRAVEVDWAGPPVWSMPLPQPADGSIGGEIGSELKLEVADPRGAANRWTVTGSLTHQLPGPLRDVTIIVNRGQPLVTRLLPTGGGRLFADAGIRQLKDPWNPGEALDLALATAHADRAPAVEAFLERECPQSKGNPYLQGVSVDTAKETANAKSELVKNLIRLSLISELAPPNVFVQGDTRCLARRETTHTMDLSRWFSQPCVIVMGFVDGESPVPIEVDGKTIPTRGVTMVRWVYPLPAAPPIYPSTTSGTDDPNQ